MTFIDQLLQAGFTEILNPYYKQSEGWFGVTKYHPDAAFKKGDKEVVLSLQGSLGMFYVDDRTLIENQEIFVAKAAKIIVLKEGKQVLYTTTTGQLPADQIIKEFLAA